KAGLSQAQLAEALEVSRQSVSKWEADAATPDTDKIKAISLLFGVSTDYLLFDENGEEPEKTDEVPSVLTAQEGGVPNGAPGDAPQVSVSRTATPRIARVFNDGYYDGSRTKKKIAVIVLLCVVVLCILTAAGIAAAHVISARPQQTGESAAEVGATVGETQRQHAGSVGSENSSVGPSDGGVQSTNAPAATQPAGPNGHEADTAASRSPERPADNKKGYPYILVHGLGGWGDGAGINSVSKYWGADSCDLAGYLDAQGYEVYVPTVGPVSSTWDRACELYAQLTGGTVDYGKAHSAAHHHARYGRTYRQALVPDWGQPGRRARVNLIGHSYGGATVRLLASLLAFGDPAELAAGGEDISLLFVGGKDSFVNSVTTLCAPHNGSSLTCIIDDLGSSVGYRNTTELIASLCFACEGITAPVRGVYDLMLDQFGIGPVTGGLPEIVNALNAVTRSENDHAGYDLSPAGAAELNGKIRTVAGVCYLSYSYSTTERGRVFTVQVPDSSTLSVLYPLALAMGSYAGKKDGGITVDKSWRENDGLVSVVSARYPFTETYTEFTQGTVPTRGLWNVMPTRKGHHGTAIGLGAGKQKTEAFYDGLFELIEKTP
ncbi:MAG: helix-turn-helix domain-containing protein, partial [Clostridia bacterium]|nr:helix-turn-helix domain-containing protein [Clostridia bacterium]